VNRALDCARRLTARGCAAKLGANMFTTKLLLCGALLGLSACASNKWSDSMVFDAAGDSGEHLVALFSQGAPGTSDWRLDESKYNFESNDNQARTWTRDQLEFTTDPSLFPSAFLAIEGCLRRDLAAQGYGLEPQSMLRIDPEFAPLGERSFVMWNAVTQGAVVLRFRSGEGVARFVLEVEVLEETYAGN
jgi:hypothetical protein